MKKTCKKCGKKYEEELYELSPEAKKFAKTQEDLMPKDILDPMRKSIIETYKECEGLCNDCIDKLPGKSKTPSKLYKKFLNSMPSNEEVIKRIVLEEVKLNKPLWKGIKEEAKRLSIAPEELMERCAEEYMNKIKAEK